MAKKEKKEKPAKAKKDKKGKPGKAPKQKPPKPRKIKLPEDSAAAVLTVLLVFIGLIDLLLVALIGYRYLNGNAPELKELLLGSTGSVEEYMPSGAPSGGLGGLELVWPDAPGEGSGC